MKIDFFNIKKTSLVKNSYYLYLSHFADYTLTLFLLPFIAKTIGAIEFGKIGIAQSFGLLIILIMEFGSSLMATREVARIKNDNINLKIFVDELLTFKILLIPMILIGSFLLIINVPIFKNNFSYILIVITGAIFQGISPVWYFQGKEKMKIIAFSKLVFRLIGFIVIILCVKSSNDSWIVLTSYSLTSALICFYLLFVIIKKHGAPTLAFSNQSINIFRKSISSFLITIFPMIYQSISIVILSIFVNPFQLGLYYGANRIYRAFNTLFGPISQAFFPIISSVSNKNKSESKILIKRYLLLIITIGVFFFLLNFLLAEQIILIFLGDEFLNSKSLLKLFSIVLPLTAISNALGRQWLMFINKDFFYSMVQLFSSFIAFITFLFFISEFEIRALPISLIAYEATVIILILIFLILNGRT